MPWWLAWRKTVIKTWLNNVAIGAWVLGILGIFSAVIFRIKLTLVTFVQRWDWSAPPLFTFPPPTAEKGFFYSMINNNLAQNSGHFFKPIYHLKLSHFFFFFFTAVCVMHEPIKLLLTGHWFHASWKGLCDWSTVLVSEWKPVHVFPGLSSLVLTG